MAKGWTRVNEALGVHGDGPGPLRRVLLVNHGNHGPHGTPSGGGRCSREKAHGPGREINGYPFTTFTDFSDFLGIIPRVSSDDLAYCVDSH